MEAVEEFNKIIDRLYYKYKSVEEMDYATFMRDYIDWDYYVNVKLKNPNTGYIDYEFPNFYDIYPLEEIDNVKDYIFIVEHSAVRYLLYIKSIIKKALKVEFTLAEYESILKHLSDYFYSSSIDILDVDSEDEEIVSLSNYLLFIENSSLKEIIQEFEENSEFADLLISSYCSDYIEAKAEDETKEEKQDTQQFINVQNSNDYIRNKLVYLMDYFVQLGYSEEEYTQLLSEYLSNFITLEVINKELAQIVFPNPNEEPYIKKYMIYIIIYDFYLTVTNSNFFSDITEEDREFAKFIEQNSLQDIFILFYNDDEFRKSAISSFELLNILPNFHNLQINDEIKTKFAPIYKIDTIFKPKNSK